jgi:kynurenine formamidase
MIFKIEVGQEQYTIDPSEPLDLSIPLSPEGPRAWYVPKMKFSPVISPQFRGSVRLGGSVNFNDVYFNPHGHGTHTESVGHIASDQISVNKALQEYFFLAAVITVTPEIISKESGWQKAGDSVITKAMVAAAIPQSSFRALVIRTMPNDSSKCSRQYSDTNFPYIDREAMEYIVSMGVEHLLVDLPSVDREHDGGLLLGHHAFWQYPQHIRSHCTITEFVYVKNEIADGLYLLNLQVAPFENDAASSRPVLYRLKTIG